MTTRHHYYCDITPFETRMAESTRVRSLYPDRVPCIIEPSCAKDPPTDKRKFVVPIDLSAANLMHVVRKRVRLDDGAALFLFVDAKHLVPMTSTIGALYDAYKSEDNFLYFRYARENAFGEVRPTCATRLSRADPADPC